MQVALVRALKRLKEEIVAEVTTAAAAAASAAAPAAADKQQPLIDGGGAVPSLVGGAYECVFSLRPWGLWAEIV